MTVHHSAHKKFHQLIDKASSAALNVPTAVVHAVSKDALQGAIDAAKRHLIKPIFVGPLHKLKAAAAACRIHLDEYEFLSVEHSHAAADAAVDLVLQGKAQAIMKGDLHTDEFMHPIVTRLHTDKRMSHCFVMDIPTYERLLIITDAAINIKPDLEDKMHIIQNAIDLAHALGVRHPKVAVLAAVETISSSMPATIDAAALSKMADRGQITGGIVDGPLAFDNAISVKAAEMKNIKSAVAGHPDILIAPDIEAGNIMVKQLDYLADAKAGGLVLGAKVPIILTSRADDSLMRETSCALAGIYLQYQHK